MSVIRLDQNTIPNSDEIRLFAKIRNEAPRLPFFLSYYRSLGVSRFFFIDNGSTDETRELLKAPDCHIFYTEAKMSAARGGISWIEPLLNQYGRDHWCVIVDADELLVYPESEVVPLPTLCRSLSRGHAEAFSCILLDMYPNCNIDEVRYCPGRSFIETCPYFDRSGYHWRKRKKGAAVGPIIVGGPRIRVFYPELQNRRLLVRIKRYTLNRCARFFPSIKPPDPFPLHKIPLVRWNNKMRFGDSAHEISFAKLTQGSGALLHFKYLGGFGEKVKEESVRKAYLGGAHYERYLERLDDAAPINFMCDLSVRFTGSRQLLELALISEIV